MTVNAPSPESVALVQGLFYVATGLWPLFSPGTFQRVTGPKADFWLVKTFGLFIAVVGAVLLLAAARRAVSLEVALLAAGGAAALAACDVAFVARRRIGPVYLLDAAAEAALVAAWAACAWQAAYRG